MDISLLDSNATGDLGSLIDVFEEVFGTEHDERPSSEYLKNLLTDPTFRAIVAKVNGQVVGGLTLYILHQYYTPQPLIYLYDLAVLVQHQRKGIGRNLIEFTQSYCRNQGAEELFVQVDKVDLYALEFYRKTKPASEEPVVHFTYRLNKNSNFF